MSTTISGNTIVRNNAILVRIWRIQTHIIVSLLLLAAMSCRENSNSAATAETHHAASLQAEIYVSAGGDDSNDGGSPERPLRTLSRAATLIRNAGRSITLVIMDDFPENSLAIQSGSPPLILTNYSKPVRLRRVIIGENNRLELRGDVTIDGNDAVNSVTVFSGSTFNMHSGTITRGKGSDEPGPGGGVSVCAGGTFNLYGGAITGNRSGNSRSDKHPAGVYVEADASSGRAGTFNMYGGAISSNDGCGVLVRCPGSRFNLYDGTIGNNSCGVQVTDGGTFEMNGGTISGHTAHAGHAGGVTVSSGSTFGMSDGKIIGNGVCSADGAAGGVYLQGRNAVFNMRGGTISGNMGSHNRSGGVYVSTGAIFNNEGGTVSGNYRNIYTPRISDVVFTGYTSVETQRTAFSQQRQESW